MPCVCVCVVFIGIKHTYHVTLHRHIGSCEWVEFELGLHVWVEYGKKGKENWGRSAFLYCKIEISSVF